MPTWTAPVRFVECDQQGVVFDPHYLVRADEAVNAWWEKCGVPWSELASRGLEYHVVASALEWRSSARWGETVEVDAELEKLGRTSLTLRFTIRVGERECCVVRTTYVCNRRGHFGPVARRRPGAPRRGVSLSGQASPSRPSPGRTARRSPP